jgi:hypothetical protein
MTFLHQHAEDRTKGKQRKTWRPVPPLTELCKRAGIDRSTYYQRRENGQTHEQALAPPKKHTRGRPDVMAAHATVNTALKDWK